MMGHDPDPIASEKFAHEHTIIERFLETPDEDSFADIFHTFQPQLIAFFRARGCERALAEDLTQEVMLRVSVKVRTTSGLGHSFGAGFLRSRATRFAGTMASGRGRCLQ